MFRRGLSCCRVELSFFLCNLYSRLQVLSSPSDEPPLSAVACTKAQHTLTFPYLYYSWCDFPCPKPLLLSSNPLLAFTAFLCLDTLPWVTSSIPNPGGFLLLPYVWKPYAWAPYSSTDIFLESTASSECCRTPGFQTP